MEWVIAAAIVVVLGLVALMATGRFGAMPEVAERDIYVPVIPDRPLLASDIDTVRFGVTVRGYAMQQVDDFLDRLAAELRQRDQELERLRSQLAQPADPFAQYDLDGGQGVPSSGSWYDGDNEASAELAVEAEAEQESAVEAEAEQELAVEAEADEELALDGEAVTERADDGESGDGESGDEPAIEALPKKSEST